MPKQHPESLPAGIAGKLKHLPSMPVAAERLMSEVLKPEPDTGEVVRIIGSDQALVGRVLSLVNSSYYGVRWKVSTVDHAVGLLGLRAIESMVISLSVFDILSPRGEHSLDHALHWQHSLAAAAAARMIAERAGYPVPEEAYTAAILHDVGRAALDIFAPEDSARAMEALKSQSGVGVLIERATIGIDHAGAGHFVLRHWNMDEKLIDAVGRHHAEDILAKSDGTPAELAGILQVADLAAWAAGFGGLDMPPKLASAEAVLAFYEGLDNAALQAEMITELKRTGELFGLESPGGVDLVAALSSATAQLGRVRALQQQLEERLARKTHALEAMKRLAESRGKGGGSEAVFKRILPAVCDAMGTERAVYLDIDASTGAIKSALVEDVTGISGAVWDISRDAPRKDEPLGRAIATGEAVMLRSENEREGLLSALGSCEAAAAPVSAGGRVEGLLLTDNSISGRALKQNDLEILHVLAAEAGIALENSLLQEYSETLKAQADTDTLTGLANRRNLLRQLEAEIQRSRRYSKPLSLVMVDLDRFKVFNDTYGHQAGDQILRSMGTLLASSSRTIDTPGRLGGEEFLVVLPETDLDEAVIYAERVRSLVEKLGERLKDRYSEHPLTISVGLTSFNHEYDDLDSLVRRVDNAMYSAKKRGRNRICSL